MSVADFTAAEISQGLQGVFRSHSERVELALLDRIRAMPWISAWTENRIYRVSEPGFIPEGPFPQITICGQELRYELSPSSEIGVTLPVRIRFLYDEDRGVLSDSDRRAGSFAEYVLLELFRERDGTKLVGARYGKTRGVVDGIEQLGPTEIGDALRKEEVDEILSAMEREEVPDIEPSGRYLEIVPIFAYTIMRSTFAPSNFADPAED